MRKNTLMIIAVLVMATSAIASDWERRDFFDDSVHVMLNGDTVEFRFAPGYAGLYSSDSASLETLVASIPEFTAMVQMAVSDPCLFLGIEATADAIFWVELLSKVSGLDKLVVQSAMNGGAGNSRASYGINAGFIAGLDNPFNNVRVLFRELPGEGYEYRYARVTLIRDDNCEVSDSLGTEINALEVRVASLEKRPTTTCTTIVRQHFFSQVDWYGRIDHSFAKSHHDFQRMLFGAQWNNRIGLEAWVGTQLFGQSSAHYYSYLTSEEFPTKTYHTGSGINVVCHLGLEKRSQMDFSIFAGHQNTKKVAQVVEQHTVKHETWLIGVRFRLERAKGIRNYLSYLVTDYQFEWGRERLYDEEKARDVSTFRINLGVQYDF